MVDLTFDDDSGVTLMGDPAIGVPRGPSERLEAGALLGRYVVLEMLGVGGMGVVYAAYDPQLDRKIAVKVLHDETVRKVSEGRARLLREAQALARLSHPNVIAVHDVGTLEGHVFVAMDFIAGRTLGRWRREKPRTAAQVVAVLIEAGQGLAAAHAAGLVHRDFKPDNVMVRDDGRVVVMDFGIARAANAEDVEPTLDPSPDRLSGSEAGNTIDLTATGALVGTPAYMAPEQHLGGPVDARSDQFAFCITLYEALYGERPFSGDRLAAVAFQVSQGIVRDPPQGARVPTRLRRVVLRGLSVDPSHRWPSMPALLAALSRAARGRGRQLVVLGLLAAVGAAFAVGPVIERQERIACAAEGELIRELWGEPARERLRASLSGSGVGDPEAAFKRLEPWLDQYADDWSRVRNDACVAERVRRTRSPALTGAALDCLTERADALEAVIQELATGERAIAIRAVEAVTNLPPLAVCEAEPRLIARVAPPDESMREQVRGARRELARARTVADSGRYQEAETIVRAVAADTEPWAYVPLAAEVSLALGNVQDRGGEYPEAMKTFEDAFVLALGIGHDEVAVDAANGLVYIAGSKLARRDEATRWERISRQLLHRIGAEDGLSASRLDMSMGTVAFAAGDNEAAQLAFERALASYQRLLGSEHPMIATAHNNLAIVSLVRGDYDQALSHHQRALTLRESLLGTEHPMTAQTYGNRGNVYYARGDYQTAVEDYRRSLEVSEQVFGPDHPDVALNLNNIGNAYDSLGDREKALDAYTRALQIRERALGPEHPLVGQTLHNMGIVSRALGQLETAQIQLERAIAIKTKAHGEDHPSVGRSLVEHARLLLKQGKPDEARTELERAVSIAEKAKGDARELADARFTLALALASDDTAKARARALAEQALAGLPQGEHDDLRGEIRGLLERLATG